MQKITLDLVPGKKMPSLHASQFDDGRAYHIDLTENRVPYVLDGTETISVIVRKCDNTLVSMDIANTFGNKSYLEFEVVEQMTACSGFNYGEIILEKNGDRLGSLNFYLQVEAAPDENGITSQSEIKNLARQVHDIVVEELADNGAEETGYDNTESGLEATNVQDAIDEVNAKIENIPSVDAYTKEESDQKFATISSIPTKTSQLQNDSDFASIDDSATASNKTWSSEKIDTKVTALSGSVDTLETLTTDEDPDSWENVPLTCTAGYYYYADGSYREEFNRAACKMPSDSGKTYRVTTNLRSTLIAGIIYFNANDVVIGYELVGDGTLKTITDYVFTTPENTASLVVQSTDREEPTLERQTTTLAFKAYTKTESDNRYVQKSSGDLTKHYGVKWNLTNPDDLGARCFDAIGLSATIGTGATNGSSDFDSIYPWSEMKRCNIKKNANGAEIVTFEGESGFALDGSNGDVFVRIPKFFYERYIKDGYEYRIISDNGLNVHPAFIENGKVLDEIFISAFEGYIDGNSKLRSVGGVIPSSNEYPQTFLTDAQANGTNYSLYDSRCVDVIFTLFAIEFACRNTNHVLGYGLADFEQPATYSAKDLITESASNTNTVRTAKWTAGQKAYMPIGSNITVCDTNQQTILTQAKITACVDGTDYTDWTFDGNPITVTTNCFIGSAAFNTNWCESSPSGALAWHTGRNDWISGSNTRNAVRYRWIENIIGNLWHYLPDVTFNALQMYVCKEMKDYEMHKITSPYLPVGDLFVENNDNGDKADTVGTNYWITELANDNFAKGVLFGKAYDKQLTSIKAFGGYYYLQTGNMIIANGGGFDHLYRCNITTQRAWISNTSKWYLYGARLMYKRLA